MDIVKTLRERATWEDPTCSIVLQQAAEEIERLRVELQKDVDDDNWNTTLG